MHEELLVVTKPVQFVKDGKALRLVRIERSRKHHAVGNAASKDFAGDGVAFDAAGSNGSRDVKEAKEVKEKPSGERRVATGEQKMRSAKHDRSEEHTSE